MAKGLTAIVYMGIAVTLLLLCLLWEWVAKFRERDLIAFWVLAKLGFI